MELEHKSIPLNYLYSGPIPMVAKTKPSTHKYRTTWVPQNTDSGLNLKKMRKKKNKKKHIHPIKQNEDASSTKKQFFS